MPKYHVYISEIHSASIRVEADNEQAALDAAYKQLENGEDFLVYEKDEAYAWPIEDDEE